MKTLIALLTFLALTSCSKNTNKVNFVRSNDTGCTLLNEDPNLNERVRDFLRKSHQELWSDSEFNWELLGPLKCKNGIRYFGRSRPRHVGMHFIITIEGGRIEYLPGL